MKIQDREKTNYKGLIIIHPHSGMVSRSVVKTRLKNYFGSISRIPDNGFAILDDVNNEIKVQQYTNVPIEE